ncbi:methyltransferase domain-containing protein [Clostridium sp.]|uniref:class I SAM-dependent methyltransferase n=1 Tax=Clostridium sp. TaxID=1506 RepID=UPI0025C0153A|nr:methyltransferase domain-containing protein [Clostridium sp.]
MFKNKFLCYYKKVLDLGCGTGRHSIYLIEEGFEVTACDIYEKTVETTKRKLYFIIVLFMIDGIINIVLKPMFVL